MKKLFFICLMMLAGSAWAEWVRYGESEETNFYFDPATIRKDGNMRRVWLIQDLKKRDKAGEMSVRVRNEYDCKNERVRVLGLSTHSEPMAGGTVLEVGGENQNWRAIAPETVNEKIFNILCAK
jgi:hypothetical protein